MADVFKVTHGGVVLFSLTEGANRCGDGGVRDITDGATEIIDAEAAINAPFMSLFPRGARSFTFNFTSMVRCDDPIAATVEQMTQVHRADALGVAAVTILIGAVTWSYAHGGITSTEGSSDRNDALVSYKLILTGPVSVS